MQNAINLSSKYNYINSVTQKEININKIKFSKEYLGKLKKLNWNEENKDHENIEKINVSNIFSPLKD